MKNKFDLSEQELNSYNRNGYVGPFDLYSSEDMKKIWSSVRRGIHDREYAAYPIDIGLTGATNISNYDRHLDINLLSHHITRPEITHRVRSIMGPDVLCWRTEFFPKYKGDEGTEWHQADTFANASGTPQILWPEEEGVKAGQGTITVWTAFTDATIQNGCLQFIPGTHDEMKYDESKDMMYDESVVNRETNEGVNRGFFGYNYNDLKIDPNWEPDESLAVSAPMKAGQFIIFSSTLMHASHPHNGENNEERIGFVARYVPTRVKVYPDTELVVEYGGRISLDRYGAVLVSGKNNYDHNKVVTENIRNCPFNVSE